MYGPAGVCTRSGSAAAAKRPGMGGPGGVNGVAMRARPSTIRIPRKAIGRPSSSPGTVTGCPAASTRKMSKKFHTPSGRWSSRRNGSSSTTSSMTTSSPAESVRATSRPRADGAVTMVSPARSRKATSRRRMRSDPSRSTRSSSKASSGSPSATRTSSSITRWRERFT